MVSTKIDHIVAIHVIYIYTDTLLVSFASYLIDKIKLNTKNKVIGIVKRKRDRHVLHGYEYFLHNQSINLIHVH